MAGTLLRRGLRTPEAARAFLDPQAYSPTPATSLPGLISIVDRLEAAILDKNVRIGEGVVIRNLPDRPDTETPSYVSRDGIVVIPKNTVIPAGTVI